MKIRFDTEDTTDDCPLSGAGLATKEDCQDCDYFEEMDGVDVICSCLQELEFNEPMHHIIGEYKEEICQETSTS